MKQNEYKELLGKVRCSDSFRKKMEERLSAETTEIHEFTEIVSGVERAHRHDVRRYAAAAAAFVLVGVTVGTVYFNAKKMTDEKASSDNKTSATAEKGDHIESSPTYDEKIEFLDNYFADIDGEALTQARFVPNGGQYTAFVLLKPLATDGNDPIDNVKETLCNTEWEQVSNEEFEYKNLYTDFYIFGRLTVNEKGYFTASDVIYKIKDEQVSVLKEALDKVVDNCDDVAKLSYAISRSKEKYGTMTADIDVTYHVRPVNEDEEEGHTLYVHGNMYIDNADYKRYFKASGTDWTHGEDITVECAANASDGVYIEYRDNVVNKITREYSVHYNYEEVPYLDYEILATLLDVNVFSEEGVSCTYSDGMYNLKRNDAQPGKTEISVKLDDLGNIIKYEEYRDGRLLCDYELTNIVYDSPDFEMPDVTTENIKNN